MHVSGKEWQKKFTLWPSTMYHSGYDREYPSKKICYFIHLEHEKCSEIWLWIVSFGQRLRNWEWEKKLKFLNQSVLGSLPVFGSLANRIPAYPKYSQNYSET